MSTANYHVLLVGIDNYSTRPLGGCVNDIDAVQRLLVGDRMRLAPDRIRRLASPLPGARHETTITEKPATRENILASLDALVAAVVSGDRVFVYYSGHGGRVPVTGTDGRTFHREALVPVDFHEGAEVPRLVFDFELNQLLRAIAARTRSVALVLDCCHSAGATRDGNDAPDRRSRFLDFARDLGRRPPLLDPAGRRSSEGTRSSLVGALDDCHVVSACLGTSRRRR